jgi:CRP-like cAMP-binding protein
VQENCSAVSGCQCQSGRTCMAKVPIFSSLSPEEMATIAEIITDKEYKKGESIYLSGDTGKRLYVINQGKVKIFRISEAGKEQIIRILYPGDFMGELSLFAHAPVDSSAEALEPTMVCVIDGDKLSQIMKEVPSIAIKIIEELSKRLLNAENLIESLGLHDVEQRVADTLLKMAADQDEITLTITKKDLAAHMGMSQETLSRKLTQFQDMGWIKQVGRKTIQILDRKSLLDIANLD